MAMLSLRQGALPVRASPVRKVAIARTPLCIRAQAAATSAASSTTVVQNGNGKGFASQSMIHSKASNTAFSTQMVASSARTGLPSSY